jgi:5'-deoxynucleotidase YfbR-like HD superfamily hydrolase
VDTYLERFLPHLSGEERTTTIRMGQRMKGMAKLHDIPEVITSDFTHHDHTSGKISSADKQQLELLAARVIFEDKPDLMALYQEFHDQRSAASQLLHDLDKIHAVIGCVFYEARYPDKTNLWPEFYPYTQSKMKTDAGRNFLETIARDKDAHIEMLRNPPTKDEAHVR